MKVALGGALAAVVVLTALTGTIPTARAQEAPADAPGLIQTGIAIYKAQYCGACHRLEAAGTRGTFGPTHDAMAATALERLADPNYAGAAESAEAYILESLLEPTAYLVPGFATTPHAMPSFAHLAAEDLDALVALLLAQEAQ